MAEASATGEVATTGSIARAAAILTALSDAPDGETLTVLVSRTGFTKTTTHRVLASLQAVDFVFQDPLSRRYRLGGRLAEIGWRAEGLDLAAMDLVSTAGSGSGSGTGAGNRARPAPPASAESQFATLLDQQARLFLSNRRLRSIVENWQGVRLLCDNMDESEVANIHWLEYLHFARDSGQQYYEEALPDTTVWSKDLAFNDPYVDHYFRYPGFRYHPVVGVNWLQAKNYCIWRTTMLLHKLYYLTFLQ